MEGPSRPDEQRVFNSFFNTSATRYSYSKLAIQM